MTKITENMKAVLGALATFEDGAFAREVLGKMEGKTFNGVNATLAAAEKKGFCTKVKAVCGEKMLTKYTITEAGNEVIAETEEVAEETEETE